MAGAALCAATFSLLRPEGPRGELKSFVPEGEAVGAALEPGQRYTDGLAAVLNTGTEPVRVLSVAPVGVRGDLPPYQVFMAAAGRGAPRRTRIGESPDDVFNPASIKPLAGFTVPPQTTAEGREGAVIIVAYKPGQAGWFSHQGLRLTYRADGQTRTVNIPTAYYGCVAPRAKCDPRRPKAAAPDSNAS